MEQWDEEFDVVVVGSGNGGLTAALSCYENGIENVLVIEKDEHYGGTSALSGGGIWIPNSHYAKEAGAEDSYEDAREYLRQTLPEGVVPDEMVETYLKKGPEMLRFMHDRTRVRYESLEKYPDYYNNLEGSREGHRSLEPAPVGADKLGDDWRNLHLAHQMMYIQNRYTPTQKEAWSLAGQNPGWMWVAFKMTMRYWLEFPWRIKQKTKLTKRLAEGQAGVARLRWSMLDRNMPVWLNCPMTKLITDDKGCIVGLEAQRDGQTIKIAAKYGVVLAAGGFEKNQEMREKYLPAPTDANWSSGVKGNTGDGINAGIAVGADTAQMDGAWWCTTFSYPGEVRPRLSIVDKSMPGNCVINKNGKRIGNESQNYMAYQLKWLESHSEENPATPAYMVFDARFRREYMVGPMMNSKLRPDVTLSKKIFESGLFTIADSIEELAEKIGVNKDNLRETVNNMSSFAETGEDPEFLRGHNAYDRYYGDPKVKPNPCLAPINQPPFYALRVEPGDFGTQGGLRTNTRAQVLNRDGNAINGLYAIGNCSAAVLPTYPGPGSTLGPAMTFGYLAGVDIASRAKAS